MLVVQAPPKASLRPNPAKPAKTDVLKLARVPCVPTPLQARQPDGVKPSRMQRILVGMTLEVHHAGAGATWHLWIQHKGMVMLNLQNESVDSKVT